jgi:hypothetical protein
MSNNAASILLDLYPPENGEHHVYLGQEAEAYVPIMVAHTCARVFNVMPVASNLRRPWGS